MKIHVYDTHVTTKNGDYYHFDVLVDDLNVSKVTHFALRYLNTIGVLNAQLNQKQCNFCHSEAANPTVKAAILEKGYYIITLEGCPAE